MTACSRSQLTFCSFIAINDIELPQQACDPSFNAVVFESTYSFIFFSALHFALEFKGRVR